MIGILSNQIKHQISIQMTQHKKYLFRFIIVVFFVAIDYQFLYGQKVICAESAISLAINAGLKEGILEPQAILLNDTTWEVSCLLCDDIDTHFQIIIIDANTGNIVSKGGSVSMCGILAGGKVAQSYFDPSINWDSIPRQKKMREPRLLNPQYLGKESNPQFSPNDELVAFEYGSRKIGVVSVGKIEFQEVCDECMYPQWLDNRWVAYLKDHKHIYKKILKRERKYVLPKSRAIMENFAYHQIVGG